MDAAQKISSDVVKNLCLEDLSTKNFTVGESYHQFIDFLKQEIESLKKIEGQARLQSNLREEIIERLNIYNEIEKVQAELSAMNFSTVLLCDKNKYVKGDYRMSEDLLFIKNPFDVAYILAYCESSQEFNLYLISSNKHDWKISCNDSAEIVSYLNLK